MRRVVKRVADYDLIQEAGLLNLSVYEYYFNLESLKAAHEQAK